MVSMATWTQFILGFTVHEIWIMYFGIWGEFMSNSPQSPQFERIHRSVSIIHSKWETSKLTRKFLPNIFDCTKEFLTQFDLVFSLFLCCFCIFQLSSSFLSGNNWLLRTLCIFKLFVSLLGYCGCGSLFTKKKRKAVFVDEEARPKSKLSIRENVQMKKIPLSLLRQKWIFAVGKRNE